MFSYLSPCDYFGNAITPVHKTEDLTLKRKSKKYLTHTDGVVEGHKKHSEFKHPGL